ncbi:hypothetical protein [Pseudoalteromonas luteoviolacea]|uniref:Uncharacterized protein n=1 Tax=Pseudoalteromonas luteoviolacea DSM 6061 TaxID=1365250 RepID=A0A166XGU2_9GAMM|nr:hypothetical protein [Pseudoalteromonas luteoviolacea]KZN40301.1 hypothetical protein N475_12610 [Pseudoalteromonas luteoviolacea DSM 6061]KZN57275.1 hypothetical protein N474_08730 [Pseudoalteromonas luteoviolacea CPMOR-2]MBE0387920.1 hypothetical protein [Pseudoalteromonas luteoviolacea DSM 6061]TQF72635.1 hypothetical protein FLM44_16970 [Pseudoalteromonas luteoviolacea]
MKLALSKKKIKALSNDNKRMPSDMTPKVAGGAYTEETCASNCNNCGGGGTNRTAGNYTCYTCRVTDACPTELC